MATSIRLLGICGSLRERSFNAALLRACHELLPEDASLDIADISRLPHYNSDIDGDATPDVVRDFKAQIANADGVLIASPEYNHSVPGVLKNAIDWASRRNPGDKTTVLNEKPLGIMGVATGAFGTVRMQQHLRLIAVGVNMHVVQRPYVLIASAREKFDDDLNLTDETTRQFVSELLTELVELARAKKAG
jgi:chromate reductase